MSDTPAFNSPLKWDSCPFCGSTKLYRDRILNPKPFVVCCNECGATGPDGKTKEAADAAWNRRPLKAAPDLAPTLAVMIKACADQFDFYAEQHLAKSPPDHAKALVNLDFAVRCRAALARAKDTQ